MTELQLSERFVSLNDPSQNQCYEAPLATVAVPQTSAVPAIDQFKPDSSQLRRDWTRQAALETWETFCREGEAKQEDEATGLLGQALAFADWMFRSDHETMHHDRARNWSTEKDLILQVRLGVKQRPAASFQDILNGIAADENLSPALRQRARFYTERGDRESEGHVIGHLLDFADAPDQRGSAELLLRRAFESEYQWDAVQTPIMVYSLLASASGVGEIAAQAGKGADALQGKSSVARGFFKALFAEGALGAAVDVSGLSAAKGISYLAKLNTLKKASALGVSASRATAAASIVGFGAETSALTVFQVGERSLTHDVSKLDGRQVLTNLESNALMIGGVKGMQMLRAPAMRGMKLAWGNNRPLAEKILATGLEHSLGLSGLVFGSQLNRTAELAPMPVGGIKEALAKDLLVYAKFGLAGKGIDHLSQGKVSGLLARPQHQAAIQQLLLLSPLRPQLPFGTRAHLKMASLFVGVESAGGGASGVKRLLWIAGEPIEVQVREGDTRSDPEIASALKAKWRQHAFEESEAGRGVREILRANPQLNAWLFGEDAPVRPKISVSLAEPSVIESPPPQIPEATETPIETAGSPSEADLVRADPELPLEIRQTADDSTQKTPKPAVIAETIIETAKSISEIADPTEGATPARSNRPFRYLALKTVLENPGIRSIRSLIAKVEIKYYEGKKASPGSHVTVATCIQQGWIQITPSGLIVTEAGKAVAQSLAKKGGAYLANLQGNPEEASAGPFETQPAEPIPTESAEQKSRATPIRITALKILASAEKPTSFRDLMHALRFGHYQGRSMGGQNTATIRKTIEFGWVTETKDGLVLSDAGRTMLKTAAEPVEKAAQEPSVSVEIFDEELPKFTFEPAEIVSEPPPPVSVRKREIGPVEVLYRRPRARPSEPAPITHPSAEGKEAICVETPSETISEPVSEKVPESPRRIPIEKETIELLGLNEGEIALYRSMSPGAKDTFHALCTALEPSQHQFLVDFLRNASLSLHPLGAEGILELVGVARLSGIKGWERGFIPRGIDQKFASEPKDRQRVFSLVEEYWAAIEVATQGGTEVEMAVPMSFNRSTMSHAAWDHLQQEILGHLSSPTYRYSEGVKTMETDLIYKSAKGEKILVEIKSTKNGTIRDPGNADPALQAFQLGLLARQNGFSRVEYVFKANEIEISLMDKIRDALFVTETPYKFLKHNRTGFEFLSRSTPMPPPIQEERSHFGPVAESILPEIEEKPNEPAASLTADVPPGPVSTMEPWLPEPVQSESTPVDPPPPSVKKPDSQKPPASLNECKSSYHETQDLKLLWTEPVKKTLNRFISLFKVNGIKSPDDFHTAAYNGLRTKTVGQTVAAMRAAAVAEIKDPERLQAIVDRLEFVDKTKSNNLSNKQSRSLIEAAALMTGELEATGIEKAQRQKAKLIAQQAEWFDIEISARLTELAAIDEMMRDPSYKKAMLDTESLERAEIRNTFLENSPDRTIEGHDISPRAILDIVRADSSTETSALRDKCQRLVTDFETVRISLGF